MSTTSYALREEFAGTVEQEIDGQTVQVPAFTGGLYRAGLDRELNIRELLDDDGALGHGPAGVIVVEDGDTTATTVLDHVPVLKRVPTPKGAENVTRWHEPGAPKSVLVAEADRRGITGASRLNREDLATVLMRHDQIVAGARLSVPQEGDAADVIVEQPLPEFRAADLLAATEATDTTTAGAKQA